MNKMKELQNRLHTTERGYEIFWENESVVAREIVVIITVSVENQRSLIIISFNGFILKSPLYFETPSNK